MRQESRIRQAHARGADSRANANEEDRKQRVLSEGMPSMVQSIADAVVIKNRNLFFLTQPNGDVPLTKGHGLGLYYNDCRYLNGYVMKLGGIHLTPLTATATQGFAAVFQLTNQETAVPDRGTIPKDTIGIRWERLLDNERLVLHDLIEFQNYGLAPVQFQLTLVFKAGFEDVYTVRQMVDDRPGKLYRTQWVNDALVFHYEGADAVHRFLAVRFSPLPGMAKQNKALFQFSLAPRQKQELALALCLAESGPRIDIARDFSICPDPKGIYGPLKVESETWLRGPTEIASDSLVLNAIIKRSMREVHMLRSDLENESFTAAGVPWFGALFGRDSLVTSVQMLAFDSSLAGQTLRLLAKYQGQQIDPWRDEEPGKILHEFRVGELANLREIPHTPYYGTVDATLLFLILLGRHAAWTGDLALFRDLKDNVEAALRWMDKYGDSDGDGYIEYQNKSERGLANQGWKDSGDAIVNADGSLAEPPISLVEVQGYAYMAKREIAELYKRAGETERARSLVRQAKDLREKFNREFWLRDKGIYALALQDGGKPAEVVSSNAGHALWAGIADDAMARQTAERMMADDMFSGWGVRTLSENEVRYNPVGYHLGTVWPHDNSIIAAGLRRYGFDEFALRIFTGMVEAAMHFDNTLPELFSGFSRKDYGAPVRYPVACHPQAWAAVTVPYLLETILGLVPEGFERRLRIVRPIFPEFVDSMEVRRLKVGDFSVDLKFKRTSQGVAADVLNVDGGLEVVVE